jgi:hypothetical protein
MPAIIRSVEYYYVMIDDKPGEAYRLLAKLAKEEVNLLAFTVIPTGPAHTQAIVFPEDSDRMKHMAERSGYTVMGPNSAILICGDDELGALVEIHYTLSNAKVNVVTSTGVTDGKGGYGYVLHVRPDDMETAKQALGI